MTSRNKVSTLAKRLVDNKINQREKGTFMEIHAICGDCGKRIKIKVNFEKTLLKDVNKIVKMFHEPYNMACEKCSIKNMETKK